MPNFNMKKAQDLRARLNGVPNKAIDARTKLTEKRSVEKLNEKTSITINERRKERRANVHASNRSLSLERGSIKITSKIPSRSATVSAGSLQITAKVDSNSKQPKQNHHYQHHNKDRNLKINTSGGITIKAKQETTPKRNKPDFNGSQLYMDREAKGHYEYERFKAAQLEKQQQKVTSPVWKQPVPITDRLDGPHIKPERAPQQTSTKVTITNLHLSVTRQDIEELFGAVGTLKSCRMLQPGAAEVVYTIKEDAITAYARYHNRNLDGQPMQCKLSSATAPSSLQSASSMGSNQPTTPPSPKLFNTPTVPYVPSKRPVTPQSQPVVFKVKI